MDLTDAPSHHSIYALPCGVDFPKELVSGLRSRLATEPPEAVGRVTLIVNTSRMKRRLESEMIRQGAGFLPKILLLTDLARLPQAHGVPDAVPNLRRKLELVQLISGLLDQQPDLAARASIFHLADSLSRLMEEMQDENVNADIIRSLDVSDLSGHWARAQAFFDIADQFVGPDHNQPDDAGHLRQVIERLRETWATQPPAAPIILAGSTASRGSTLELMSTIAELPQGAVVLPGFDWSQPEEVWMQMANAPNEDHPQFRYVRLMQHLDLHPSQIARWTAKLPAVEDRNHLVSLALRPAPVTDAWMRDGPNLQNISHAMQAVTLLETSTPREEASVIAMRLRLAAETGQRAALVTPDRMLSRQVTAALQRWNILPDDSAGTPLHLTAPGRFLRLLAGVERRPIDSGVLLSLLKHPLCHTGQDRGPHLILTRDLELHLRSEGIPYPDGRAVQAWASARKTDGAEVWGDWVATQLCFDPDISPQPVEDRLTRLRHRAEILASGPDGRDAGNLWDKAAGGQALDLVNELMQEAKGAGALSAADFADLLGALLAAGQVRDRDAPHPNIMILGTLEARVGGADLVILGGLNEGSWPEAAAPDPWLNRPMRKQAGLLLPERRIGLSAHDFQQAIAEPEVWLSRSKKSDDTETVPSRWINRIVNLLTGLKTNGGPEALDEMKARGNEWMAKARELEKTLPTPLASRPKPVPPLAKRPKSLSVTRIKTLIRDPYAIYAKNILKLQPLFPLVRAPDAMLRGIVVHEILEKVVRLDIVDADGLMALANDILLENVPWPSTRALWAARLGRLAEGFLRDEAARKNLGAPAYMEVMMRAELASLGFTLTAQADRIDRQPDGQLRIYDYKTGTVPSVRVQETYDKQLLLEAAMAERGGIDGDANPQSVAAAEFLGVGSKLSRVQAPLDSHPPARVWAEFAELIEKYQQPDQGYTARRSMQKDSDRSDYDHLARFGEWDLTHDPVKVILT